MLGDLCLTRVNGEVFSYERKDQYTPFDRVFMCDVLKKGESERAKTVFLAELYRRCLAYSCLRLYFESAFVRQVEANGEEGDTLEVLLERKLLYDRRPPLTDLGHFLVDNYCDTGSEAARQALFTRYPDEGDWIFYLAIHPTQYRGFIESLRSHFGDSSVRSKGTTKVVLLEKPFQLTSESASELAAYLKEVSKEVPALRFFAVDHYAAKWSLSEIPLLRETAPSFARFVDNSSEVIIELLERQTTPRFRFGYMVPTGLYFDMMPHALVPLQFLYSERIVSAEARLLAAGAYRGYREEVENWLEDQGRGITPCYETYFSLRLDLEIAPPLTPDHENLEGRSDQAKRKVTVYLRSGKGMAVDRKRVIIKRRKGGREDDPGEGEIGLVRIDIAGEEFEANASSSVALPPHVLKVGAAKKFIRGYAKILFDVMQYFSALASGDARGMIELLTVEKARNVIENIELIRKALGDGLSRDRLIEYEPGEALILDETSERVFRLPFE